MSTPAFRPRRLGGFSLIELLVGIAISMIGLLVMYKTVTLWDARTRATIAGGDTQVAGTLAAFEIERDIKLAGMGFGKASAADLGCTVTGTDAATATALSFALMPVQIIDNDATGQPDELRVLYGSSPFFPNLAQFTLSTGSTKKMVNRYGFKPGDLAVVTDAAVGVPGSSNCALVQITDDTVADNLTLKHEAVNYTNYYAAAASDARYNTPPAAVAFAAGNMYSLGPDPRRNVWTVVGDSLRSVDTLHGTTADYAEGVASMKVLYGYDTNGDKQIVDTEWTKTPPVNADWRNLLAVRVSLLLRSRNFEKPATGPDAQVYLAGNPQYHGAGNGLVNFPMRNLNGTADSNVAGSPNNWRYYRYRVYEKVIPLRNMLWGTVL